MTSPSFVDGCRFSGSFRWSAAAFLILIAAGCDGEDQARDAITPADTFGSIVRSPEDTMMPGPADTQQMDQELTARLVEWEIELPTETVPARDVTFRVTNGGTVEHALEVEGEGMEEETDHLQPGESATLTVDLRPGTYEVYCPVVTDGVSHREQGMTTNLVVR